MKEISTFLSWTGWNTITNLFTVLGFVSTLLTVIRIIHNNKIPEWNTSVEIKCYPSTFDFLEKYPEPIISSLQNLQAQTKIIFRPVNCIIRRVELYRILPCPGQDKLLMIETHKNVSPDTPICFQVDLGELEADYMLRWYIDFGKYSEYYFQENLLNGINDKNGFVYRSNFISMLKRAIGMR